MVLKPRLLSFPLFSGRADALGPPGERQPRHAGAEGRSPVGWAGLPAPRTRGSCGARPSACPPTGVGLAGSGRARRHLARRAAPAAEGTSAGRARPGDVAEPGRLLPLRRPRAQQSGTGSGKEQCSGRSPVGVWPPSRGLLDFALCSFLGRFKR